MELEVAINIEHKEKEMWKVRALALEGQLRKGELKGLDFSFSEPFSSRTVPRLSGLRSNAVLETFPTCSNAIPAR